MLHAFVGSETAAGSRSIVSRKTGYRPLKQAVQ
jgi:hypothetical protein